MTWRIYDFALRYVRIYSGVNSRAELVTLAPGLPPLARGLTNHVHYPMENVRQLFAASPIRVLYTYQMLICQVNKQIYLSRSPKRLFFKYKYNLKMQSTISRSSPWPILFLSFIASSHIGTTGTIATNFSHVIIMEMQKRFLEYMDITYCLKSYTESYYVYGWRFVAKFNNVYLYSTYAF